MAGQRDNSIIAKTGLNDRSSASGGAGMVGYNSGEDGAVGTTVWDALSHRLNVKGFGAVGDGYTDDTEAFRSAINAATASEKTLVVPSPSVSYRISGNLQIDLGRMSIVGDAAILDFSGLAANQTAINVFSSRDFPALQNFANRMSGLILQGGDVAGTKGIVYGHATYTASNDLLIENCCIRQFQRLLEFTDNAWRAKFVNCRFEDAYSSTPGVDNYAIYAPHAWDGATGIKNAGECMAFTGCMFQGARQLLMLNIGQWDFAGCSLLNSKITVDGDVGGVWTGGNMENPGSNGSDGYYYVNLLDVKARFKFNGGRIVVNKPVGGVFDCSPLKCLDGNTNGFTFNGLHWPAVGLHATDPTQDTFRPFSADRTAGNALLVEGTGRVEVAGGTTYGDLASHHNLAVSAAISPIVNGGGTSTTGWTVVTTTFTTSAAKTRDGFKMAGAGSISQTVPATPGKLGILHLFGYVDTAGGYSWAISWLDGAANPISSVGTTYTVGGAVLADVWKYQGQAAGVAPPGTCAAKVTITNNSAGNIYVDNIFLNLV